MIEYLEVDDGECVGLDMYSSKTIAWIFKESKWGEVAQVTFEKSETMFLNGGLHYMGYAMGGHHILAVDIEGKTWRKIPNRARGFRHYIHQAQGHLCECIVSGRNMSKLSIWILEDYGTNK